MPPAPARITTLDLIRGVAVLGILAVNITGFAGPIELTDTPALPHSPPLPADEALFAVAFLLFEGKMRALFSLLFGASLLLFVEKAEAGGRDGDLMQARRLFWLGCFGYLHYILLWWGDILFLYAVAGMLALMLRRLPVPALLALGLAGFAAWHLWGMAASLPAILAEEHARLGLASLDETQTIAPALADLNQRLAAHTAQQHLPFSALVADKLATAPFWPFSMTIWTLGETLPLMLIGMALYRSGFYEERWPRRRLVLLAAGGLALGGAMALALLALALPRHFPPLAMPYVLSYWAGPEHLLMALAYACLLLLAAPRLLATGLGRRLAACGRMAFSNYLLTTLVMTFLFYRWGLGLADTIPRAAQPLFVALGWAAMLTASPWWLARFRQGPLEWLWRSLTEARFMPTR